MACDSRHDLPAMTLNVPRQLHSSEARQHMGMPPAYYVCALTHATQFAACRRAGDDVAQALAPGRAKVLNSSFPVACDCAEVRQTTRRKLWRLVLSGALLAAQWGAYAWAVGHTSLAHTLLFLSATPVLLAGWHWAARQPISAGKSIRLMPSAPEQD